MRDERIDLLRFFGLAMIILAHVGPPMVIFQLRNFDVPLLVMVSGMSFGKAPTFEPYKQYIRRRIKRLVPPVWIFLTCYFSAAWLIDFPIPHLDWMRVLKSYLLISGIGYVWIIRVFLLVALVAPLISRYDRRLASDGRFLAGMSVLLLGHEGLRFMCYDHIQEGAGKLVSQFAFYILPYAAIFALGLRTISLKSRLTLVVAGLSLGVFLSMALLLFTQSGRFVPTQEYKYPPSIYYFSYAVFVALMLWLSSEKLWLAIAKITPIKKFVLLVAQNSLWVYLWHIPFVELARGGFAVKYLVVFSAAATITYLQTGLVRNFILPKVPSESARKTITVLFTG
ncbi:MAG: acyltransferase [Deltaproteobacteria bacterium]|nr:acyltransferase [Deltaproteobacteria bacterium]